MKSTTWTHVTAMTAVFSLSLGMWGSFSNEVKAQSGGQVIGAPKFKVDPFWPKPLPDRWVFTRVGAICVDAQDHVFTVNRGNLTDFEQKTAIAPPMVTEFDPEGNLVNSWGTRDSLPKEPHGCLVDYQGNLWIAGNRDAIVQKYTHDGSKMLLQIGTKGRFDTSDHTITGAPMNSSHTLLDQPLSIAVDPTNGDVYITDGEANRRVAVFDSSGHFLRQWGRQGTIEEVEAGEGGVFLRLLDCVVISNDGLVYVTDTAGHRIEVFDKMGNFKRNIQIEGTIATLPGVESACSLGFSPDPAQRFMYVGTCEVGEVRILDRATGRALSSFGRQGEAVGEFTRVHFLTVDSKGNIIVGDTPGRRIEMWRLVK